jgi:hypothetical protein
VNPLGGTCAIKVNPMHAFIPSGVKRGEGVGVDAIVRKDVVISYLNLNIFLKTSLFIYFLSFFFLGGEGGIEI